MIFKRSLLLILSYVLYFSAISAAQWDGNMGCSFGGGNGSASNPFIIDNQFHLDFLHKYIPSSYDSGIGTHFKLTNHIDLKGIPWEPIGNFKGTLDGNGYTINNLVIISSEQEVGFFRRAEWATIKNLGIVGDSKIQGNNYVGTLVGRGLYSTISNCYSMATVSGVNCGGLVSLATGISFSNCYNTGTIKGRYNGFTAGTGGIAGALMHGSTIKNCYNTGTIINDGGDAWMGGLTGFVLDATIENSYSAGTIVNAGSKTGAVIGNIEGIVTITNCYFDRQTSIVGNGIGNIHPTVSQVIGNPVSKTIAEMYNIFFGNSSYVTHSNHYPELRVFANSTIEETKKASAISIIPIRLAFGQTANTISQNFEVPSQSLLGNPIYWQSESTVVTVKNGTSIALIHDNFNDKLLTVKHDKFSRQWMLSAAGITFNRTLTISPYPPVNGVIQINGNTIDRSTYKFISSSPNNIEISAIPNPGYKFNGWSNAITHSTTPTSISINSNKTLGANFTSWGYILTANINEGGKISHKGKITVGQNSNHTYTITPDNGYYIKDVKHNNASKPSAVSSGTYTISNITSSHTIEVIFEAGYTITASSNTGGTISKSGRITISPCGSETFTFNANAGYKISEVKINDVNNPTAVNDGKYTFDNVFKDQTIEVIFNPIEYTIKATAGSGGSITPTGTVTVNHGDNKTFTFKSNAGYKISEVKINGSSNSTAVNDGKYTFNNVSKDQTIEIIFNPIEYTIKATAGSGGSITPTGTVTVNHGDNKTFTFNANAGYKIAEVKINGVNNPTAVTNGSYTFNNITAPHTIEVIFNSTEYTITATAGSGGSITPAGIITVNHGDNKTFTFNANAGYKIAEVKINGVNNPTAVTNGSYTFNNITAPHTIEVIFNSTEYTITATAGSGGSITPAGIITVNHGRSQQFTFKPNNGYKVSTVKINNITTTINNNTYTFSNVTKNQTITVTFTKINLTTTYKLTIQTPQNGKVQVRYTRNGIIVNETVSTSKVFSNLLDGTNVTLTAIPNNGYKFVRWTEDVSGSNASQSLIINNNKTLGSLFEKLADTPSDENKIVVLWGNVLAVHNKDNEALLGQATYRWYKNGELLSGNRFYIELGNPIPPGNYTVEIINNNSTVYKLSYIISDTKVRVYPNPLSVNSTFFVGSETRKISHCDVYNVTGTKVETAIQLIGERLSINNISIAGIYFVRIEYESGGIEIVKLLVY